MPTITRLPGARLRRLAVAVCLALMVAACSRPSIEEPAPSAFGSQPQPDEIVRQYPRSAVESWQAVVKTLQQNQFGIVQQDHDRLGGDLAANRSAGSVFVRVKELEPGKSSVSIRLEPPDRTLSFQLHENLAQAFGLGEAAGGLFGGDSEKGSYPLPLDHALRIAEEVFRALGLEETRRDAQAKRVDLNGRRSDSTPVRIRMSSSENGTTTVTFLAGTSSSDDHKALAKDMKRTFENRARLQNLGHRRHP